MKVLITGGSGYLGQHLLATLQASSPELELGFTYCRSHLPEPLEALGLPSFQVDLTDPSSVAAAVRSFAPAVVVHTAAQSSPAGAAKDPDGALAANAPACLLEALGTLDGARPLVVYTSTDQVPEMGPATLHTRGATHANPTTLPRNTRNAGQVFSGRAGEAPYVPSDTPQPANAYGDSKLAFETALKGDQWGSHFVVLRSSNMVSAGRCGCLGDWYASDGTACIGRRLRRWGRHLRTRAPPSFCSGSRTSWTARKTTKP